MHENGNVGHRGPSVAATKKARVVPRINHPLSTPACYVIVGQFILNCVANVVTFGLTYSFLAIAIPIALLFKIVKKCAVHVRILSQGGDRKAEIGSAEEKFWFVKSADETRLIPSLVLMLVLKGQLSVESVEFLVRNRLSYSKDNEEKAPLCRLARVPRYIFHELVWFESCDLGDKAVNEIKLGAAAAADAVRMPCMFQHQKRKFIIENCSSNKDSWQIYLYSNAGEAMLRADNNLILFRFHHCYADMSTLVHFLSRNFLDNPTFAFRGEVHSSTQALCLGVMALFSGPSIFLRTLLKTKDRILLEPASRNRTRAIFYSEPVARVEVETITTATGTSANDVVLSCLAGSLRACLRQSGDAFPPDINVYLPMNLQYSSSLKCFTSFNILSLPVGTEGAIPRLWEMRLRRSHISSLVQAAIMSTVVQLAFLILPDDLARRFIQFIMEKSSCAVTCILGQTIVAEKLLLDGRPVESFVPIDDSGYGISITITEYEDKFQLAVLAPDAEDWVIRPAQLCAAFTCKLRELSARLTERARVIRERGQRLLNSRKNSVFIVEDEE